MLTVRRRARVATLVLTALVVLCAGTAAQAASTVTVDAFGVTYDGDAGVNSVVVSDAPAAPGFTRVRFAEVGVVAQAGCSQDGPNAAFCDVDDFEGVSMFTLEGNDVVTVNTTRVDAFVRADEGDDRLTGSDGEVSAFGGIGDSLHGEEGQDELIGRAGDDVLDAGPGNDDLVDGGPGDDSFSMTEEEGSGDLLRGGPGFDHLGAFFAGDGEDPGVTIDLAAGTAQYPNFPVTRLESVEDASGDDGDDTLLGTPGTNLLRGAEGNDVIDGRAGPDRLRGMAGNDRLEGRDGSADQLDGAAGNDVCDADQLDLRTGCEGGALVNLPPFGSPVADRVAPRCGLAGVRKRADAGRFRRRGISFRATCDEAGRLAVRLVGTVKRLRGKARRARAGELDLASRVRRVAAGSRVSLRIKAGRRFRGLLRAGTRVRLVVVATDAAGNERTTARRVRLR